MARPRCHTRRAAAEHAKKKVDDDNDVEESEYEQSDSQDDDEDDKEEDKSYVIEANGSDSQESKDQEVDDDDGEKIDFSRQRPKLENVATKTAPRKKKKKNSEKYDTDTSDEGHLLPTVMRKTNKGGYAHTKRSRARISKANTGNTPWNKGRQRSEADKAKIAAAVRARNQAILKEKLKLFNMTEEEFRAKQKEIKYLRERVRRAKADSKKLAKQLDDNTLSLQVQLDQAIALRDQVVNTKTKPFDKKAAKAKRKQEEAAGVSLQVKIEDGGQAADKCSEEQQGGQLIVDGGGAERMEEETQAEVAVKLSTEDVPDKDEQEPDIGELGEAENGTKANHKTTTRKKAKAVKAPPPSRFPIVAWSMEWTPHEFDCAPPTCPNGGPSGLVCCDACSTAYSRFMSQTVEDMEARRMESVSSKVDELLGYIEETRMQLLVSTQAARKMAPPQPPPQVAVAKRGRNTKATNIETHQPDTTLMDWCVTSTLDMSNWGPSIVRI